MSAGDEKRVGRLVAAIDVGSNTVRALAASLRPDRMLVPIANAYRMTALGRGLSRSGRLEPKAIAETVEFVAGFLKQCASLDAVYCVGTAACREAANTSALQDALRDRAGVELEVVSARVEGHLSFIGAIAAADLPAEQAPVVADVGGRSTEVVTRRRRGFRSVSSPIGARSLTEACLVSDPPSRGELTAARRAAESELSGALELLRAGETFVAAGGTACSAALLMGGRRAISLQQLQRLRRRVCALSLRDRRSLMSFDPPRAEIICGGLIILEVLAAHSQQLMRVSTGGIREGLLIRRTRARGIIAPPLTPPPPPAPGASP